MSGRKGIMLCYPFEEKRLATWEPPYIVQPKLDGERCRYLPTAGGNSLLLSSEENIFFSIPHIKQFLDSKGVMIQLDGELYTHGFPLEKIVSIASRQTSLHPECLSLEYHVFDIVDTSKHQLERLRILEELKKYIQDGPVKFVPWFLAYTLDDVLRSYDSIVEKGYEGIVVRNVENYYVQRRSTQLMKFKPKKIDDYLILAYTEEVSKDGIPKGTLGSLTCIGNDSTPFNVGSGFTREQRETLWKERETLPGRTCRVKYQNLTSANGVPRHSVFVSILDEE